MALLNIETGADNKILRTKSVKVARADKKLVKFLDSMRETMIKSDGSGLAAPQVGKNIRIIVCHLNQGTKNELLVDMINPEITAHSDDTNFAEEGCLSLPKQFDDVERYTDITVNFTDRKSNLQTLKLSDMNARIVQHEVDHLNGVLFIDRVKSKILP